MRRLLVLFAVLLVASSAGPAHAQDRGWASSVAYRAYQSIWCAYMHVRPYYLRAPEDLACDYDARPMSRQEAQTLYTDYARHTNYLLSQWGCAWERSKSGLSWKQEQEWSKRLAKLDRFWARRLSAVDWPPDVEKKVSRVLDLGSAEAYRRREAYSHRSYLASVTSGDWKSYLTASNKASEASSVVRMTLGLPQVPAAPNECKQARRLERELGL